ncbi:MAG: SMP-30/gluconolactonase/LRE family protein [Proteobacteria bacterium]|nr:SMP-30/gluconolactonase/LRE family protein [Pseudomonadota bacterium]
MSTIGRESVVAVHHANAMTGETPFWEESTGTLWWIDIQAQRLLGHLPSSGRTHDIALPAMPGFVTGRRQGGLLLGLEDGIYPYDRAGGLGPRIAAVEADDPRTRVNDGRADPVGRLWFGTMEKTGSGEPIGALYRMDLDGRVAKIRGEVRVPNGIEFSPDGTRFYFTDSRTRTIEAMDFDAATGTPGKPSVFARYPEGVTPDGSCIDSEGCLWVALIGAGRIERLRPDGSLDATVELPVSRPTMPLLGGADGRTMFITSQRRFLSREALAAEPLAGDLLAVRVPAKARQQLLAGF